MFSKKIDNKFFNFTDNLNQLPDKNDLLPLNLSLHIEIN